MLIVFSGPPKGTDAGKSNKKMSKLILRFSRWKENRGEKWMLDFQWDPVIEMRVM